jgi:hypothetical protein
MQLRLSSAARARSAAPVGRAGRPPRQAHASSATAESCGTNHAHDFDMMTHLFMGIQENYVNDAIDE